ncbi:hypothetical protein Taro_042376 [Colocasia esculenta]|uniref:Uncharacterized protein n=1 Tax=Colocasia esculenta TaxID=4460 RepID=A0A843WZF7_COLES|nr:hypothetical protein [Colocasia esculenta]
MSGWQVGQSDLSGCRGAQGGHVLVAVWAAIMIPLVSRRPAPSRSRGQRLKALAGSPFPSFPFFPSLQHSEEESFPLRRSSSSGLAERRQFMRNGGASPCVGDPGMWHPCGQTSYWCRDCRAHRDTRGGVAPVGRDLIAAHEAVAIRVSRPGCPSRQGSSRDARPCRDRVVAT